jgi:hypothetical protein
VTAFAVNVSGVGGVASDRRGDDIDGDDGGAKRAATAVVAVAGATASVGDDDDVRDDCGYGMAVWQAVS